MSKMETQGEKMKTERRNDIDWLRVLAMLTVFLFHCARFFDHDGWHVKNNQLNLGVSIFVGFLVKWLMPTFFVLSGISAYYSLNYRTTGQYFTARVKRLFIPFILGAFTHIPLQVYFERVSHSQFAGSFIDFFPHYFDGWYGFGGNFAWMGLHLWYLEMLFIFSLITLPLFLYLKRETTHSLISRLADFLQKPGAVFLFAVPLGIIEMFVNLQPDGIGRRDFGGWSIAIYPIFFIYGYLIATNLKFKQTIEKHRIVALVMALSISVILFAVGFLPIRSNVSPRGYLFSFLRAFDSWFWVVAILGFGGKHLNFNNRFLKYANEAVLPFYILHQTIIVTIGFYIASWDANIMVKFPIIITSSFAAIIILYELIIRRINTLRFLFGMKTK